MKVALIGGGGFRTPILYEALLSPDVRVDELVLHDVNGARLERIEAVLKGLDKERAGSGLPVRATTSLEDAVEGAGAVLCAIREGGLEGRVVDETVPLALGVLGQETVGPGGICFALRTVPAVLEIAGLAAEMAPEAWFLNFTNPAGLVTEAVQGVLANRAVGICDSPTALCRRVASALGRSPPELWFDYFGLNHLGWLRSVLAPEGDLLPALLADEERVARLEEVRLFGTDRLRKLGMVPNEYLVYYERADLIRRSTEDGRGTRGQLLLQQQRAFYESGSALPSEALAVWRRVRAERDATYMAEAREPGRATETRVAWGPEETPDSDWLGYAGVAVSLLRALGRSEHEVLILSVANRSSLPFLDAAAVVEVPCIVASAEVLPAEVGEVPSEQREMIERVKEVERLTIRAAVTGSAGAALEALALHPIVPSRETAEEILARYLERHPGLRERLR